MTGRPNAVRMLHEAPEGLPDTETAEGGDRHGTGAREARREMREAFADQVEQLVDYHDSEDVEQVAVQGEISSMKSWLAAFAAKRLQERGEAVTILVPQRVNRGDIAGRLEEHGVPYIELPARWDLCAWDEWRDRASYVDENVCSSNGCDRYPGKRDHKEIADQALSKRRTFYGRPLQVDQETAVELSEKLEPSICPFYLADALDERVGAEDAVRVATVEKAFSNPERGGVSDADVVLVDEAHEVSADTERLKRTVDIEELLDSVSSASDLLRTSSRHQQEAKRNLEGLRDLLSEWARGGEMDPTELLDEHPDPVGTWFDVVNEAGEALQPRMNAASWETAEGATDAYRSLKTVREFLSELSRWSEGNSDFVHIDYDAEAGSVERAHFRLVDEEASFGASDSVYEAWEERGTHPAVVDRWSDLLDKHLRGIYGSRTVHPGGSRAFPKPAPRPLDLLRELTGAETLVGLSATHNEASDPSRDPEEARSTRHPLVTIPMRLRTNGDDRAGYHGKDEVTPETPWFRELITESVEETGASLAAVPVNTRNEKKWDGLPVRRLPVPDGSGDERTANGLVPNSRGAVGSKELEREDVDAVLCGVQVQSPEETACYLLELWEMVGSDHTDLEEALAESWRILAQSVVSGTVQAGGRFSPGTPNLVFERGNLLELAGFEFEQATAETLGVAGAMVRQFEDRRTPWEAQMQRVRAKKIVSYLVESGSKAPTPNQYLSAYQDKYEASPERAKGALWTAVEEEEVELVNDRLRIV